MAVPAVPADVTNGNTISAAHMNSLLDLAAFHRNDVPILKMRQTATSAQSPNWAPDEQVATSTTIECHFSNGSGTFSVTPIINVGGFTAGTGGDIGVYVPETGVYLLTIYARWTTDSGGNRLIALLDEGSAIAAGGNQLSAVSGGATIHGVSTRHFFTAGDELGAEVTQTSGSEIGCLLYLEAEWLNSSAS